MEVVKYSITAVMSGESETTASYVDGQLQRETKTWVLCKASIEPWHLATTPSSTWPLIGVIHSPDYLLPHQQTVMSMLIPSPLFHGNPFIISVMA